MEEIRRLTGGEIPGALQLCRRVFDEFVAPGYTAEGRERFYALTGPCHNTAAAERGEFGFYGAFVNGELAGAAAVRAQDCHIILLFVEPRFQGRGLARRLVARMAQDTGCAALSVNSSPYAVRAYERMGFARTGEETQRQGIIFTPMRLEAGKAL